MASAIDSAEDELTAWSVAKLYFVFKQHTQSHYPFGQSGVKGLILASSSALYLGEG